jgi:hypothetical protein
MLRIRHPSNRIQERSYIYQVMLGDWLGLEFVSIIHPAETTVIELSSSPHESSVTIRDVFLQCPDDSWLTEKSLPGKTIHHWVPPLGVKTAGTSLPVIFGERLRSGDYLSIHDRQIEIGIDIFGSAFFMLSRYEELALPVRDQFNRFPSTASVAHSAGFLGRPIVNEYLELLWWALKQAFPALQRRYRGYKMILSHDVDNPFAFADKSVAKVMRMMGGAIVHSGFRASGAKRAALIARVWRGAYELDPLNSFDFLMDCAEKVSLVSTFNFVCGRTNLQFDPSYDVNEKPIRKLMARIRDRGNLIGFHGSFESYNSPEILHKEFGTLHSLADQEGIRQEVWGGRQHYLRWVAPTTWRIWNEVGLSYDSTVGYADIAGFRCGTCYEYAVFDLQNRCRLNLEERPLLIMDTTLFSPSYMGLSLEKAVEVVESTARVCRLFRGSFTLLWHNHFLQDPAHRELFVECLKIGRLSY